MKTKNASNLTKNERAHLARVKVAPCSVCDREGPSAAHHINQGQHFTAVALCWDCHQGPQGWHGTKVLWRIRKLDELAAARKDCIMTARELLEAAAKAAGIEFDGEWSETDRMSVGLGGFWNPMTDDGDALRLAVKLRLFPMAEEWSDGWWVFIPSCPEAAERLDGDPYAATRRAIVRAAAAIGAKT